jgi:hypothetical protein
MTTNWADLEGRHEWLTADHDTATDHEHEPPTQPAPWIPQPINDGWQAHLDRMDAAADARHAARLAARGAA